MEQVNIKTITTWVILIAPFVCRSNWLKKLLGGLIIMRVYQGDRLINQIRLSDYL